MTLSLCMLFYYFDVVVSTALTGFQRKGENNTCLFLIFYICIFFNRIRRGWQVYREVCSTCHSIKFVAFRNLIGVSHSEAEVRRRGCSPCPRSCTLPYIAGYAV